MIELIVKRTDLLEALSCAQNFIDKKTTMSVLKNILLYTNDAKLIIEATDLEISYQTKLSCDIKKEGSILLDPKKIYELTKELPFENIRIEESDNFWIKIKSENNTETDNEEMEYEIAGLPADEFPRFIKYTNEKFLSIESSILKEMIDKTIFSIASDDAKTKIGLTGINFEVINENNLKKIRMVSSDSLRLSLIDKIIDSDFELEKPIIIPKKGASELKKILDRCKSINIAIQDKFLFVLTEGENENITIRLIDDKFPPYRAIIPENKNNSITIDRLKLINTLKRLTILTNDVYDSIKIKLNNDILELETLQNETGRAKETIPVNVENANFTEIVFNGRFVLNILSVMRSKNINLTINNSKSPCLITGSEDEGFLSIFMPIII
ncbi:MAG: DNA polymerase III subunit beta [Deltaproteobacteria bacterium]|jgi:DNA polymerase-3 subunit beta|nr:DNA polymerase III subunit beta [Deltaproteobacteria bacterium]